MIDGNKTLKIIDAIIENYNINDGKYESWESAIHAAAIYEEEINVAEEHFLDCFLKIAAEHPQNASQFRQLIAYLTL